MSSDNPYGPTQPGPWGQGGPAPGPSGPPPYGYPPAGGPAQPPGPPGSGYAFGPFAPQPGAGPGPTPAGAAPPPRGRGRTLVILGVVALALILVGVGAAVLIRRGTATPQPQPTPTNGGGPTPSATSAPPAGALASDAVAGYLKALAAGDADGALGYAATPVPAGKFMTDAVLAAAVERAPITEISVPEVSDPAATTVAASYNVGKTAVTVDYGVQQVGGAWKLSTVHKTVDLGLVRSPSIPIRMNGVKITSDFVDVLPGAYAFTAESPNLSLGSKAVMVIKHPNDYASVLDLRPGLSDAGRKTVLDLARKSYAGCLKAKVTRPKNCPFSWVNPDQRYRQNSATWRQLGADPFRKPTVATIERSARIGIPLRVRISGPCTFSGTSGTCSGNVTGRGVASIRMDKDPLKVVWLT